MVPTEPAAPTGHEHDRWWHTVLHHLRAEWPAAFFVAALVMHAHDQVGWLDAVESYAFTRLAPSTLAIESSDALAYHGKRPQAVVVQIDQEAQEQRYLDRSPLPRCALRDDLRSIYRTIDARNVQLRARREAKSDQPPTPFLDLVVVDLDLSPSIWLSNQANTTVGDAEIGCARELNALIVAYSGGGPFVVDEGCTDTQLLRHDTTSDRASVVPIRTVLMKPFDLIDGRNQRCWEAAMTKAGVEFGDPRLRLEYGLVIKQGCDSGSLTVTAQRFIPGPQAPCITKASELEKTTEPGVQSDDEREQPSHPIGPQHYRTGLINVPARGTDHAATACPATTALTKALFACDEHVRPIRAVFFGGAYGSGDQYLTPAHEQFGVNVHAASVLSFLDPIGKKGRFATYAIDVGFSIVFGLIIAACWRGYFDAKLETPEKWWRPPLWLAALVLGVLGAALLLSFVSAGLLAIYGLWTSPIPVAIGMFIEAFVTGSVVTGVHEANRLLGHAEPVPKSFGDSVVSFFGGKSYALWNERRGVALWTLAKTTIWIAVVATLVIHR